MQKVKLIKNKKGYFIQTEYGSWKDNLERYSLFNFIGSLIYIENEKDPKNPIIGRIIFNNLKKKFYIKQLLNVQDGIIYTQIKFNTGIPVLLKQDTHFKNYTSLKEFDNEDWYNMINTIIEESKKFFNCKEIKEDEERYGNNYVFQNRNKKGDLRIFTPRFYINRFYFIIVHKENIGLIIDYYNPEKDYYVLIDLYNEVLSVLSRYLPTTLFEHDSIILEKKKEDEFKI